MISGFSPFPNKYRDLLKRETYGEEWYNPVIGFPMALVMMLVWDLIIRPYRKLF